MIPEDCSGSGDTDGLGHTSANLLTYFLEPFKERRNKPIQFFTCRS